MPSPEQQAVLDRLKAQTAASSAKTATVLSAQALKAKKTGKPTPPADKRVHAPDVVVLEDVWREELRRLYPEGVIPHWADKERGQASQLLLRVKGQTEVVIAAIRYQIRFWDKLVGQYFKKIHPRPTIGMLLKYSEQLLVDAQLWAKHSAVIDEYAKWEQAHKNAKPPADLWKRYSNAVDALKDADVL